MPTMRGRNQLEAASGTMPRWENTKPKRAASDAMRISIASCMVTPMPTAGAVHRGDHRLQAFEDRAASPGRRRRAPADRCSRPCHRPSRFTGPRRASRSNVLAPDERSAPAQKPRPAPVTMMARTSSSLSAASNASISLVLHRAVEGIELVGPVQRDGEDLFVDLVLDGLIRHGALPSCYFFVS